MDQLRFILADRFGFSWESIKNMPAHIAQKYLIDISRSKNNFKGMSGQSVRKFANDMKSAGIPVD
jgi:hypothetical protein